MPQKQESSDSMHIEATAPLQIPIHDDLEEAKASSIYEVIFLCLEHSWRSSLIFYREMRLVTRSTEKDCTLSSLQRK